MRTKHFMTKFFTSKFCSENIPLDTTDLALSDLPGGTRGTISRMPHCHNLTNRFVALGLVLGVEVKVIQNYHHGPLLVEVNGTRLALGRGEAAKIWVRAA